MKPTLLYRIAASVRLLAAAHSVGFQRSSADAEGVAVRDAMFNTHFALHGGLQLRRFYNGFGLSVGIYMLFAAFLAWHLGSLASAIRRRSVRSASCSARCRSRSS